VVEQTVAAEMQETFIRMFPDDPTTRIRRAEQKTRHKINGFILRHFGTGTYYVKVTFDKITDALWWVSMGTTLVPLREFVLNAFFCKPIRSTVDRIRFVAHRTLNEDLAMDLAAKGENHLLAGHHTCDLLAR
jgi:hypothetical protein